MLCVNRQFCVALLEMYHCEARLGLFFTGRVEWDGSAAVRVMRTGCVVQV